MIDCRYRGQIGKMLQAAALATQAQEQDGDFSRGRMAALEAAAVAIDCQGNGPGLDIIFRSESLGILGGLVYLCVTGNGENFEKKRGMVSGYASAFLMLGGTLAEFGELATQARQNVGAVAALVDVGQTVIGAGDGQ